MAYLVPSLKVLFQELDVVWPDRDRRTDGWIGDANHCPGTSDHCADAAGRVHAIDIDKDGIDPALVIERLVEYPGVIRYINYNYRQYHVRNQFEDRPLGGTDPHTSHLHVSIEKTDYARNFTDGYGIIPVGQITQILLPDMQITPQADWDHSTLIYDFASHVSRNGATWDGFGDLIEQLRI